MKILRFYIKLPPLPGGMEKHIYNLSLCQIKQGNDVVVVFNHGEKVSTTDIKILSGINLYKIKPQFISFFVFYLFSTIYLIVNKQKVDVIHVHGDWSSLLFIRLLKKITSAKIICFSFHGEFLLNKTTHRRFLVYLLKNIDLVFVNGYDSYCEIKKRFSLKKNTVFWRPSGISSAFKVIKKQDKTSMFKIITTSNLIKRKNLHFVLNIAKLSPNINYYLVGEGPERKNLTNRISKEQILNVYLLGEKSEEELVHLLNSSDLFLLPSFSEGSPTAIIEAMACGLPIICSNAGNIEKLIGNGENGFVIKNFNEKDYLEKIYLLKKSQLLIDKIQKKNIEKAQEYYWEHVANEISTHFETAIKNN